MIEPATSPPLEMELSGLRLVEASAGTGKTFALVGLYLRLLIEKRLGVRDVLVMTFTRAATQELRDRIRARLMRAARIAVDRGVADAGDDADRITLDLIGKGEQRGEARAALARRLVDAAARMDEATITTIHGFSQMAVAENAFDSLVAFDRGEQTDDKPLRREAVADYWRRQVIGGEHPGLERLWPTPDECFQDVDRVLAKPHLAISGPSVVDLERRARAARDAWTKSRGALLAVLERILSADELTKNGLLRKEIAAAGDAAGLFDQIDRSVAVGHYEHAALELLATERLPSQLKGQAKKKGVDAALTGVVDDLLSTAAAIRGLEIRKAAEDVAGRLPRLKRDRRLFTFDDMIRALHDAVGDPERGPALVAALRERWPWALVDEFQDTDPLQYAIFRAVYGPRPGVDSGLRRNDGAGGPGDGRPDGRRGSDGGMIMIGDPKQAIYGFRGGDVFAYLQAAADADGRYTMDRNFRSTKEVLTAVEAVFRMPGSNPFLLDDIEFHSVASGRPAGDRAIELDGRPLPAMTIWHVDADPSGKRATVEKVRPILERQTVAAISRLLHPKTGATVVERRVGNRAAERAARETASSVVDRSDGTSETAARPLEPHDVCVLVNSNRQASDMQRALAKAGIPAACLHQASVFSTDEAEAMLRLLRAVATPTDARRVRASLADELFGLRLGRLLELEGDEALLEECHDRFHEAHQRWARDGVLAMLEPLIQDAGPRILSWDDGERRMTNWLHLAECLQSAEPETFGMAGLVHWLSEQIRDGGDRDTEAAETAQLRLESDESLVRVTTIYKAKGLEFPVVFVPYAPMIGTQGTRFERPGTPPFEFHDDRNDAWLNLGTGNVEAEGARSIRERKAEALRVLYVALTRAAQAVFFAWGCINDSQNAALASLFHRDDGAREDAWPTKANENDWYTSEVVRDRLERLAADGGGAIDVVAVDGAVAPPAALDPPTPPEGVARNDLPDERSHWGVHSFTSLVRDDHRGVAPRSGADDEADADSDGDAATASPSETPTDPDLQGLFGRGFGSALHDILENADFEAWPAADAAPDAARRKDVEGHLLRHGIGVKAGKPGDRVVDAVVRLVSRTLATPLPAIGPLAGLPPERRLAEMPFTFRLGGSSADDVIAILARRGYESALPASGRARALRGLMHGAVDLVAECDGRYWVLDYKSNHLGDRLGDYAPARMKDAVRAAHYDLQYLIYLTALHRHLGRRLPGYDPGKHLGGAQYLFLRGLNGIDAATGVHVDEPDGNLIALVRELDAVLDGRSAAA